MEMKNIKYSNSIILVMFFLIIGRTLCCEEITDTVQNEVVKETVISDSTKVTKTQQTKVDSLSYSADNGFFNIDENKISLSGNAKINYQDIFIEADSLDLDLKKERANSIGNILIKQGKQIFLSKNVIMNIDNKKGILYNGAGSMDLGYIYGSEIRKVSDNVYDIDNGKFTTCDSINPHYYIKSNKLRVYLDDKIAGKPVVYYVNHFPIFALPFASFPIVRGRRNGFLIPQPGWNSSDGKYIKNIAYYYHYKDYYDAKTSFNFYEKKGWDFKFNNKYNVRYLLSGNFAYTYRNRTRHGNVITDWSLLGNHRQTLKNNASISANINYATSKTIWDSSTNIDDRLTEMINSSISYSKSFDNSRLNISNYYSENFVTKTKTITLPSLRYSQTSTPFYEVFGLKTKDVKDSWWKSFSYNYNFVASHYGKINDPDASFKDIIWSNHSITENQYDSDGNPLLDPDGNPISITKIVNQHNFGAKNSFTFSFSPKISDYFSINQSASYYEAWFDRTKKEDGFARGNSYSLSTSISTKLYGLKKFNSNFLKAIRHVVTPRISFSYQPDFSKNSDFYSFSSINLSSGKRRRSISFSLNQIWQVKYWDSNTETQKKINNLFSMNSSCSYNLEKDRKKLSDITHSLSFNPNSMLWRDIEISYDNKLSTRHSFYDKQWGNLNFKNWKFNQNIAFSGSMHFFNYFPQKENPLKSGSRVVKDTLDYYALNYEDYSGTASDKNWTLMLSHEMSFPKDIFAPKSSNVGISLNCYLSDTWSMTYSDRINLLKGESMSHSLSLNKDLHCWTLSFDYSQSNDIWEYKILLSSKKLADVMKFPFEDRN